MDIEKYRELIQSIIEKYSRCNCEDTEVETQIAFDRERDELISLSIETRLDFAISESLLINASSTEMR
jgi:XisI protein